MRKIIALIALALLTLGAHAQCLERTGQNATLIVTEAPPGPIRITHNGDCIGEGVYEDRPIAIAMWQDDPMVAGQKGPMPGDYVTFSDPEPQLLYEERGIYIMEVSTDSLEAMMQARLDSMSAAVAVAVANDAVQDSVIAAQGEIIARQDSLLAQRDADFAAFRARIDELESLLVYVAGRMQTATDSLNTVR